MDVRRRVVRPGYEYGGEINIEDLRPRPNGGVQWRIRFGYLPRHLFFTMETRIPNCSPCSPPIHELSDRIIVQCGDLPLENMRPFYVGLLCVGINTLIFSYLAVWLRHIKKTNEKWEAIAPGAIPTATILGVAAFLMFVFALWPVWGFLTLPLMVKLFMAFVIISPCLPPYTKTNKEGSRAD